MNIQIKHNFPTEMTLIFKGLSDDVRLGILNSLLENEKMTFNEIKKTFKLNSSSLTNHLRLLQNGNLIRNYYEKSNKKIQSYYSPTEIPKLLFDSCYDILYGQDSDKDNTTLEIFQINELGDMIDQLWNAKNKITTFEDISTTRIRARK